MGMQVVILHMSNSEQNESQRIIICVGCGLDLMVIRDLTVIRDLMVIRDVMIIDLII